MRSSRCYLLLISQHMHPEMPSVMVHSTSALAALTSCPARMHACTAARSPRLLAAKKCAMKNVPIPGQRGGPKGKPASVNTQVGKPRGARVKAGLIWCHRSDQQCIFPCALGRAPQTQRARGTYTYTSYTHMSTASGSEKECIPRSIRTAHTQRYYSHLYSLRIYCMVN